MKIVLASTSAVKMDACREAFASKAGVEIVGVKVPSGVAEQPFDGETVKGAMNRIDAARKLEPDADAWISIENGIFTDAGAFDDRAVVAVMDKTGTAVSATSDGVAFDAKAVSEARARGFDQWTVGKVMAEWGLVAKHDDPHLSLSGIPRATYIGQALDRALGDARLKL